MRCLWSLLLVAGCGRLGFDARATGSNGADATGDAKPADVTAGLAFYYTLDSLPGHDLTSNAGGNAYVPSLTDVTPVAGKLNGALHWDGVGYQAYALFPADAGGTCAAAPTFPGGLTASVWAKPDSFHDWNGYTLGNFAIAQGSSGGTGGVFGLGTTNACGTQTAGFTLAFSDTLRATRCGTRVISTGTWYLITGVYDPTARAMHVYVDGALDDGAMSSSSSAIGSSLNPPPMCAYLAAAGNQSQMFIGALDEARIYDRPLSSAEVAQLYAHY